MRLRQLLTTLGVLGFAFLCTLDAGAFCLTHTCDPRKEQCELTASHCNIGGKALFWASSIVTWDVQKDGSTTAGIDAEMLESVVAGAFQRWEDADCGAGQGPLIQLVDLGPIACGKPEYNQTQPNANVITFHDAPWPYSDAGAQTNTLALTTVFFNPNTGEIFDANVEINSAQQPFGLTDKNGKFDLNAVLTHELGHFLGLSHSEDHPSATMFNSYDPGMVTLEADDVAGICASLGPGARVINDSTAPRHGFSGACAQPESGCCSSAIGGPIPPGQALGPWAMALGACAWLGRGRIRRRARSARALQR